MSSSDELRKENAALTERISALSAAILRVSASLDVETVMREVLESAIALTSAHNGVIAAIDGTGGTREYLMSGFTAEEQRQLVNWPDAQAFFTHLCQLPGTVRQRDLPRYVESLGFAPKPLPSSAFQGTPMLHRGVHVGHFFLGKKDGEDEFTAEEEEVLVLFATQAAAAIANARTYRDEKRARTDLEALVDTSPVGVVVFDANKGKPVSLNQEARRIVEALGSPGSTPEQLLDTVTYRRADGREVAVADVELKEGLTTGEKVRGEEIVLSVPDGRSVAVLVNATPISSENGNIETVVATMQDLEPLEELERMRAEFVRLVSHELRAPLTSIKGSTTTVLTEAEHLERAEMLQFFRIIDEQADHMRRLTQDLLDAGRIETGTLSVAPAPVDVAGLVEQARSTFISGGGRHVVQIDLPPDLPPVMADERRIVQVLNNLLSNAARHSPESSPVTVAAELDGVHVAISVSDEGRGVPQDQLPHLFRKNTVPPGGGLFRGVRGSGLGLVICKGLVEAHGGRISAESDGIDQGARLTFTIPTASGARNGTPGLHPRGRSPSTWNGRQKARVLVVDDDPQTLRYVRGALEGAGYMPLVTGDAREIADLIRKEDPHLVLLDLLLPETDGIDLMQRVPELSDLPVIFISGYRRDETIARALEVGAADYIVKPFSPTELVARVQAALRSRAEPEPFVSGDLAIHHEQRRVTVAGRQVRLTATEYTVLRALATNAGRVSTYDYLLRRVWSGKDSGNPKLVRAFVKRLRGKLGDDPADPVYIFTERGVGYTMARPGDSLES